MLRPSTFAEKALHYSGFRCSGKEAKLAHCGVDRNASLFQDIPCDHIEDAGIFSFVVCLITLGAHAQRGLQ